jgi:hypothetical protein
LKDNLRFSFNGTFGKAEFRFKRNRSYYLSLRKGLSSRGISGVL